MTDKPSDNYGSISISGQKSDPEPTAPRPSRRKKEKPAKPTKQSRQPGRQARVEEKRGSKRKLFSWLTFIVFLFGLYSALGYLLIPYLIKNYLPDYLEEKHQVHLSTGKTSFNPYNFKLVVRDLSLETIVEEQPKDRFLSIDDLRINLNFLSLLRGDLTCSELRFERLKLHIIREHDKTYNISYLFNGNKLQNQSDIIDFADLPFLFSFNNISVSESRVIINDRISNKEHVIKEMELALPVISNFPYQTDSYIHPRFSAVINGSPVSLSGKASLGGGSQPEQQTELSLDLDNIDIPIYFDYLPLTLPVDISKGTANGVLHLTFSPKEDRGSRFKIRFNLETTDLSLESRDSKMSMEMPVARLEGSLEPFSRALEFKSILLREPAIFTDRAEDAPIGSTLASLAPLALRPPLEHKLHQVIPPINIKLLIADGGSFTVRDERKNKTLQHWESIQLSIKNFTNDLLIPQEGESSFRLSGEHGTTSAFFTWQGNFDKENHPSGNIQLSNMPASIIAPFLGRNTKDISGNADLRGLLSVSSSSEKDKPFDYSLKSSKLSIKDLVLKENGVEWLRSPEMRCDPVSKVKGITDLGNIYLKNSTVHIYRDQLPFLFLVFSARPTQHILHGVDFSGRITIAGGKKSKQSLVLKDVIFQANKLEKQETQKENFVFSALLGSNSEVKAKGSLHIAPIQINTQTSATNLSPAQLFSWFSNSKTMLNNRANISIKGSFLYPQQEFSGELAAENLIIGNPKQPEFNAASVRFNNFTWSKTRQSLSAGQIQVDQPKFSWRREAEDNPVELTSTFMRRLLLPEQDDKKADPALSLAKFSVDIDQIGISNGMVSYSDERTKPPLILSINGINGELQKLQYPVAKENSVINLNGSIDGLPFKLEGGGKLLQSPPTAETHFSISSVPLSLISDQVKGRIKDIDTEKVTANVDFHGRWNKQSPGHEARLSFSNLVPKKSGTNLATAFALLTGTGATTIELKSDSSIGKPIIKEALDHFSRIMVKASINPLLLADPKFTDLVENEFVSFLPGTDELTGESLERLNRYGELLSAYPLINLELTGRADPESDVSVLLEALKKAEQIRVDAENRKRELEWQKKQELEKMKLQIWEESGQGEINEIDIPISNDAFAPVSPKSVQVTNKVLNELALRREQAVIDHLVEQLSIAPDRLVHRESDNLGIVRADDSPRVVFRLTDGYDDFEKLSEQELE